MRIVNNPHDKLFKETMSDIEVAKDFFLNYFPGEILNKIELSNVQLVKDSYVEK